MSGPLAGPWSLETRHGCCRAILGMVTEVELHAFLRDVLGLTDAEIEEHETEMVVEWLTVGLPREDAAVGMEPLAYQRMLNDIMDLAEARNAERRSTEQRGQ